MDVLNVGGFIFILTTALAIPELSALLQRFRFSIRSVFFLKVPAVDLPASIESRDLPEVSAFFPPLSPQCSLSMGTIGS